MLIAQQNEKGGLLGRKLEPVVVDPASDWPLFAEKARQLLSVDKVAAVFGCWTSVSRKSVLPVFEELNGLLFYPVQYEGQECSRNVFYTGAAPNQQAIPAVDYLMNESKVTRWVLAGTDYVYPRTTNQILEANMAHGEMVMLGAYTTFVVQQALGASFAGLELVLSIPAAFAVSGAAGVVIEWALISRLYGRPLETLLATWGLSLILQQAVRSIFGASNRSVLTPRWMSGEVRLGGLALTDNRLGIIIFAALVFAALMAVLRFTPLGLRMRAVTQNRLMAASMGIRTTWIDALTFGLGSGVAGVALSQIDNVSPNLGQGSIIDSFMVVVFGGAGNLWGTALGSLTLGIVNKFLEPVAGAVLGKIAVLRRGRRPPGSWSSEAA